MHPSRPSRVLVVSPKQDFVEHFMIARFLDPLVLNISSEIMKSAYHPGIYANISPSSCALKRLLLPNDKSRSTIDKKKNTKLSQPGSLCILVENRLHLSQYAFSNEMSRICPHYQPSLLFLTGRGTLIEHTDCVPRCSYRKIEPEGDKCVLQYLLPTHPASVG